VRLSGSLQKLVGYWDGFQKLQNQFHSIPLTLANQLMKFVSSTTLPVNHSKISVNFGCTYLLHATTLIFHLPHTSHPSHHETPIPPSLNKPFHYLSNKLSPQNSHLHPSVNTYHSLTPSIPIKISQIPTSANIQPTLIYTHLLSFYHPKHAHTFLKLKTTHFLPTIRQLITSLKNLVTSFPAPHMHTAHTPHCQHMISTSPYTSTSQPIYPPKNTHTFTQHTYSSPAALPLQYLLSNMHSLPAIKHPTSSFQITPFLKALLPPHCSHSPIHNPSCTNTQTHPTTTHPPSLLIPSTPSQLHPDSPTSLSTQPLPIRLYNPNPPHIQHTLPHHRYLTLLMTSMHFSNSQSPLYTFSSFTDSIAGILSINVHNSILALHLYRLTFLHFSITTTLPRLLTAFDSHMYILTLLLVGNADQLTPLQVLTHPSTHFPRLPASTWANPPEAPSDASARKKKLSLTLDLLKLTLLTGADPDPSGPIAIRDFPVDCRQLPHRKTAASDSLHVHS
jgi:hypothetical protein